MPGGGRTPQWAAFHPFVFGLLFASIGGAFGIYMASRHNFSAGSIRNALILGAICFVLGIAGGFLRRLSPGP